ncbi:rod shape-determining protein RodA [Soehngenia longivitae]|uniref:rod shape-determining protein RodA n=1 Tax=Soehngenia longivitae TaxID=2562294 RepID=UPI001FD76C8F|nr:rod shape-determining protein RodA [Soehngenia longivitae]
MIINLNKKSFKKFDFVLLVTTILLSIYGIVMIYSATLSLNSTRYVETQAISTIIGLIAILVLIFFDYQILEKLYIPIYILSIGLLVAVLLVGVGDEQWGSRSWLYIGSFGFQPAEFAKLGIIISLAKIIDKNKENINSPKVLAKVLIFAFVPVALILRQPDLGTAIVFVFFTAVMLFVAGLRIKYYLVALGAGILSLPIVWLQMDNYQKERILNFINPERDASNTGYQALQSKIAIGSGKIFGRGLFNGTQTQLNYLPEKQTDFIFAVLVEELGFIGGAILLLLYFIMLMRMIKIAKNTTDTFASLVITGIASLMFFHIFQNVGMTIGLMPITGIPLPFMSYGGTFQLINLVCVGIVLSIGLHKEGLNF